MTNVIWKFKVLPAGPDVLMPKGSRILSVDNQHESIVCWAAVDPLQELVPRRIVVAGTGHIPFVDTFKLPFIGTVLLDRGNFAFHLFDGGEQ